ncbi:MAG: NAD-dependent epimerase/dehydratase family protein [Nanoarchaeota archaeon]|nr:NAD-dependent epimerase/dehydratase family protein [Nanoarchaeota archaeon]
MELSTIITGSHGRIGKIITPYLMDKYLCKYILVDKKNPIYPLDILKDDFPNRSDALIHLAANPDPFIERDEARKNVDITKKIIKNLENNGTVKLIVNASSINVYNYRDLEKITLETPLDANRAFNKNGYYGLAKIESESLLNEYCRRSHTTLLNLRLGWVSENDKHPPNAEDRPHPRDLEIALKHNDLKIIFEKCLTERLPYSRTLNFVCISKKESFIGSDIRFPI